METDGLASIALARACLQLGYEVTLLTEECNAPIFFAAIKSSNQEEFMLLSKITLSFCPSLPNPDEIWLTNNYEIMNTLTPPCVLEYLVCHTFNTN
jgi:hypothetical protein